MISIFVIFLQIIEVLSFLTSFRYGINENRFEKCPSGAEPQRSREGNIIWCKNNSDCVEHNTCTAIDGFLHFGTQIRYCCPTRMSICLLPPQPGYGECGKKPKRMYYFDAIRLRCQPFKVVDCFGTNENRFMTAEDCAEQCERTACKAGESMLMDRDGPRLCGTTLCPRNYVCRYDALFRRHVCCGYLNGGACAMGYRTYMSTTKGVPWKCTINYIKDECPTDFLCTSTAESQNNYCCSLENGVCPLGQTPYYHPLTSKTVKCNPSSGLSDCPSGFTCSAAVIGAIWGFCCSQHVTALCPSNSLPYINPITSEPQKCAIGITICGLGFECVNNEENSLIGFCCSSIFTSVIPTKKPFMKNNSRKNRLKMTTNEKTKDDGSVKTTATNFELNTVSPLFYNTRQLRIIDIQKEIDRQNYLKNKRLRSLALYGGFRSMDDELTCPLTHRQMFYEDGSSVECHLFKKCPAGLECVSPPGGFLAKSICCERIVDMNDEHIEANGSKDDYSLKLSSTSDPFCPTVIEKRYCVPGDITYCTKRGFFCQFNVIRQQFMCCSLSSFLAVKQDIL